MGLTTYDWQEYFKNFCTKVAGIKKLHHIRFDSAHPGYIFVKERAGSPEVKRSILKDESWSPKADELPPVLSPAGLSNQRQWYLHDKIREFCPDRLKDITCPQPSAPPEFATSTSNSINTTTTTTTTTTHLIASSPHHLR